MNLQHLKATECPGCKAQLVSETLKFDAVTGGILRHVNGECWEEQRFSCGRTVHWVPNFSSEEVVVPCGRSPEMFKRFVARQALHSKIADLIEKDPADADYRDRLMRDLPKPGRW